MPARYKPRCYLCLEDNSRKQLQLLTNGEARRIYQEFVHVSTNPLVLSDQPVGSVCGPCLYQCMRWNNFKLVAHSADKQLRSLTFNKIPYCRICLNMNPMLAVHQIEDEKTRKVLLDATGVKTVPEDKGHLCSQCYNKCTWWNVFRTQAVKSYRFLLADSGEVSEEANQIEIRLEDVDKVIPELLQMGWVNHSIDIVKDERDGQRVE